MTRLLTLIGCARVGRLALVAAALIIGIVAFGAPAVIDAAGPAQGWLSEPRPHDYPYHHRWEFWLGGPFHWLAINNAMVGGAPAP